MSFQCNSRLRFVHNFRRRTVMLKAKVVFTDLQDFLSLVLNRSELNVGLCVVLNDKYSQGCVLDAYNWGTRGLNGHTHIL